MAKVTNSASCERSVGRLGVGDLGASGLGVGDLGASGLGVGDLGASGLGRLGASGLGAGNLGGLGASGLVDAVLIMSFHAHDRRYTSWHFQELKSKEREDSDAEQVIPPADFDFQPQQSKLFSNDILSLSTSGSVTVISSPARQAIHAGILLLSHRKTYGREPKSTKHPRLLYECIPNDSTLPSFWIPYEIQANFHKKPDNLYVLFKFVAWTTTQLPLGQLTETLGPIHDSDAYSRYEWHAHGLHKSTCYPPRAPIAIEPTAESILALFPHFIDERTTERVITIDSKGTRLRDDAISVTSTRNVKVYITHVAAWWIVLQELYGIPLPDFARNDSIPSNVYTQSRRHAIYPPWFESLVSLECERPWCLGWVAEFSRSGNQSPKSPKFYASIFRVAANYHEEDNDSAALLHDDLTYQAWTAGDSSPPEYHVAAWMVRYNRAAAQVLYTTECPAWYQTGPGPAIGEGGGGPPPDDIIPPAVQRRRLHFQSRGMEPPKKYITGFVGGSAAAAAAAYVTATSPARRVTDGWHQWWMAFGNDARIPVFPSKEVVAKGMQQISRYQTRIQQREWIIEPGQEFKAWIVARDEETKEYTLFIPTLKYTTRWTSAATATMMPWDEPMICRIWVFEDEYCWTKRYQLEVMNAV